MKSLYAQRRINAPLELVWKVISDVGDYARYAPNLNSSRIVSGEGKGLIRECTSKEGLWQEICTDWQEQEFYLFEVQTQAKNYPFPFKTLNGKWEVCNSGDTHTDIRMKFDFEFKNLLLGWLIYPLMRRKFITICEQLLDNWQLEIHQSAR